MKTAINSSNGRRRRRRSLIVGLGGSGHWIALHLKALALMLWPAEEVERYFRILVFDTTHEELAVTVEDRRITLEPGREIFDIGQTPVADIKRNLERQTAIKERFGNVIAGLPPTVLRSGAKQIRPFGGVSFYWRYSEVEARLQEAIWALADRERSDGPEGINVVIANSLVGGTGSSTFLDTAYVIRQLCDELGTLADFCYITGVGILPRAFHDIEGQNLIPNAVASLKELNFCMLHGGFQARYPNGRVISTERPPFDVYYLVDGVDERGHTWSGHHEVCRLAAEAIFLQLGSRIGSKHENDFDNLDDVLLQQTEEGVGTFYGSFGLASLEFSGSGVARICAAWQAGRVLEQSLLVQPAEDDPPLEPQAARFIESAELEPERLSERLACDDEGLPLTAELAVPGWVNRLSTQAVPGELVRYVRDYEQTRLGVDFKRWLTQNETQVAGKAVQQLTEQLHRLARQSGLPRARLFLEKLAGQLDKIMAQLGSRQADRESRQMTLSQELGHLELVFLQAAEGSFWGRGRRVTRAQHSYLTTAQSLFELRWQNQLAAAMLAVLGRVDQALQSGLEDCRATQSRLQAVHRTLQAMKGEEEDSRGAAGITTRSLVTPALVTQLFEQYAPPVDDTLATLFSQWRSPLEWRQLPPQEIEAALLASCEPAFAPIARLSVEQVLALPAAETSSEGHYAWLNSQATPSWNLDRTRLPDGGASLQRLEVLGVPDQANTIYRQRARMLVSTGDPERVTAFVARIGAPHTAIQQWDQYQAAYEQVRGRTPLHVLPQFQADNNRARQTFALGSIFGFITSQGSYFYYQPADPLERPLKLAQGLANSLKAFTGQETLVQEAWDRVEQVVAGRGVKAILRHLRQYYELPNPNGREPVDELVLELKRLVRAYAEELRQIHQFAPGVDWLDPDGSGPDQEAGTEEETDDHRS